MKKRHYYISLTGLILLTTLVSAIFYLRNISLYVEEVSKSNLVIIDIITEAIIKEAENKDVDYQLMAKYYNELTGIRIIITTNDSKLLADSSKNHIVGQYYDSVLSEAKRGVVSRKILKDRASSALVISSAEPPVVIGSTVILIEIIKVVPEIHKISSVIFQTILFNLLILIIALLLFNSFFKEEVRFQINLLLKHMQRALTSGKDSIEIDSSSEEVGKLIESFNMLLSRYNSLIVADNSKYSRITTIFSSISSGIIAVDLNNRISMVNNQAERLLQIDKADIFGSKKKTINSNRLLSTVLEQTEKVNNNGTDRKFSIETEDKRVLEVSITVITNKYIPYDKFGVLAIIVDVTDILRLENLRSEFVSNVSHELRTPLTLIQGFVETLKEWDTLKDRDRRRSLEIIEIEANRLGRLISELLLLSEIEGNLEKIYEESIDTAKIVIDTVTTLQPLADEKNINFSVSIEENVPQIKGIPSWFRQIVGNLCENAVKYSHKESEIIIELKKINRSIILQVIDHGIGIKESDQLKIFERFYRVDKSRNSSIGGSGLGLAIAGHIANEFGGNITLESKVGVGSRFILTLPLT